MKENEIQTLQTAYDAMRSLLKKHTQITDNQTQGDSCSESEMDICVEDDEGNEEHVSFDGIENQRNGNIRDTDMFKFCIHMQSVYGCTEPRVGITFNTAKQSASFIRDYCLLQKKKEWRVSSSGAHILYKCAYNKLLSRYGDCPFLIKIVIKRKEKTAIIKEVDLHHHEMCDVLPKPTMKQMIQLSGPQLQVFNEPNSSKYDIAHSIKSQHGIHLS